MQHTPACPAGTVKIRTVLRDAAEIENSVIGAFGRPFILVGGGFSEIIESGPDELAHDKGVVVLTLEFMIGHRPPRRTAEVEAVDLKIVLSFELLEEPVGIFPAAAERRSALRRIDRSIREIVMVDGIDIGFVVEAFHIHIVEQTAADAVVAVVEPGRRRTGGVLVMADRAQAPGHFRPFRNVLLVNLVADAPHDDARMVGVAPDHIPEIAFRPFVKVKIVAVRTFRELPFVKRLAEHQKPELVAQIEKFRIRRIVRGPDRIASDSLELEETVTRRVAVHSRAQRSQIVMQTHAPELQGRAVDEETANRIEHRIAQSEPDFPFFLPEFQNKTVEMRRVRMPERGILNPESAGEIRRSLHGSAECGRPVRRGNGNSQMRRFLFRVVNPDRHADTAALRADPHSPVVDMDTPGSHKPDMPVDAASGIPAAGLRIVLRLHRENILSGMHKIREINGKGGISVRPSSGIFPVAVDFRVGHDAVEFHADMPGKLLPHQEAFPVESFPDMRQSARSSGKGVMIGTVSGGIQDRDLRIVLRRKGPADRPVMRHINALPCGVVEVRLFKSFSDTSRKTPVPFQIAVHENLLFHENCSSVCPISGIPNFRSAPLQYDFLEK